MPYSQSPIECGGSGRPFQALGLSLIGSGLLGEGASVLLQIGNVPDSCTYTSAGLGVGGEPALEMGCKAVKWGMQIAPQLGQKLGGLAAGHSCAWVGVCAFAQH